MDEYLFILEDHIRQTKDFKTLQLPDLEKLCKKAKEILS